MTKKNKLDSDNSLCEGALCILNEAETLFAQKGFPAVSMNEIAQQAKVSKANIFHHFKSKESLYLAVLKQACNRSSVALELVNKQSAENKVEQMKFFFSNHLQTLLSQSSSTRLIQRELMENSEHRGKQLAEEVFADSFAKVIHLVREAQSHGFIRESIEPALLAFLLIGTNVIFFETQAMLKHLPDVHFTESPSRYNSAVFDILVNGFK
ncbi:MAG: TetR/AcrR family transcriptional regulator [Methylococcales bacterium]